MNYREHSPSIIFMDEIDSIGSSRLEGGSGGDSEVQRTMLELLNQLDGFEPKQNIKVGNGNTDKADTTISSSPFYWVNVVWVVSEIVVCC